MTYLDIKNIVKQSFKLNELNNLLFSKKNCFIFDIMNKTPITLDKFITKFCKF